jgi:DnaJ-class molecular chaperone
MKTLYDLLGVDAEATQAQIEQGYRRQLDHYLARQSAGKGEHEIRRMQNIREAYLLLCSPPKRQIYDHQLRMFQKARAQLFNPGKLIRAGLLLLGLTAAIGGIYLRQTMHDQKRTAETQRDQAQFSAAPSQTDQANADTRRH